MFRRDRYHKRIKQSEKCFKAASKHFSILGIYKSEFMLIYYELYSIIYACVYYT